MKTFTQTTGIVLIVISILGLIASGIINYIIVQADGGLPAVSFFMLMVGIAFVFPELLQDSSNSLSTMRVIVFMVVSVFCLLYVKMGWELKDMKLFTIDKAWIYILGLAFGGKVVQSFSGDNKGNKDANNQPSNEETEPSQQSEAVG